MLFRGLFNLLRSFFKGAAKGAKFAGKQYYIELRALGAGIRQARSRSNKAHLVAAPGSFLDLVYQKLSRSVRLRKYENPFETIIRRIVFQIRTKFHFRRIMRGKGVAKIRQLCPKKSGALIKSITTRSKRGSVKFISRRKDAYLMNWGPKRELNTLQKIFSYVVRSESPKWMKEAIGLAYREAYGSGIHRVIGWLPNTSYTRELVEGYWLLDELLKG